MRKLITHIALMFCAVACFAATIEEKYSDAFSEPNTSILERLLYKKGASEFQIDQWVGHEEEQFKFLKENGSQMERPKVLTIKQFREKQPGIAEHHTKGWIKGKVMNKNSYRYNLEVVATLEVTVIHAPNSKSTSYHPLGRDSEGAYRIPLLIRD